MLQTTDSFPLQLVTDRLQRNADITDMLLVDASFQHATARVAIQIANSIPSGRTVLVFVTD